MAKDEAETPTIVIDDPTVTHDQLIDQFEKRTAEEYARKSDAGESAAAVRAFCDEHGVNPQAFRWVRSILLKLKKKNGQHKAMDITRSLNHMLPMVENHIVGQGTAEMDLGEGDKADAEEPQDETVADDPAVEVDDAEAAEVEGDFDDLDEDDDDFEEALANISDDEDDDNVVPLNEAS